MKKLIPFFFLLIVIGFSCSKEDDPTPTLGCNVTFKGTAYAFTIAICVDATTGSTVDGLSAANIGGTQGFVIARDSADPDFDALSITLNTSDMTGASTYSASVGVTSKPTITRNGKNWTFSGTAMNINLDSGAISGSCTCTN